ncbi:hypothetical protein Tco_0886005, partial [Tanacetum coccineum]
MQTRSSSKFVGQPSTNPTSTISNRRNRKRSKQRVEPFNIEEPIENQAPPVVTMADQRTMAQLLKAPTEGYEDAIVVPEINADNFEIKHGLLTLYDTSTPGISPDVAELKYIVKALLLDKENQSQAPASVKAGEESCVTCGGAHSYRNCPATVGNVYHDNIQECVSQAAAANFNQGNTGYPPPYQALAPQIQGVSKNDFESYVKANDAIMRNMQNQTQNMQNQMTNLTDLLTKFMNSNTASTSGSETLPSNTVTNLKEDLKGITTRSGVAYQGPTIPTTSSSPKVVERETEVTKDTVPPTNNGSTKDVQPLVVQVENQIPISEPVVAPVSAPMPNPKPSIPYPLRRNDERCHEKANDQIEKFYEIFRDLSFEISLMDALILMPKFSSTLKALIGNKEKLSEMARTPLNEH